jgi:hypothetical protein
MQPAAQPASHTPARRATRSCRSASSRSGARSRCGNAPGPACHLSGRTRSRRNTSSR